MKKLIITIIVFLMVAVNGYSLSIASSNEKPHYLQWVSVAKMYIDKNIFVHVDGSSVIYQGKCLAISDSVIIIRDVSTSNIRILTIPMSRVSKFYIMEE